MPSMPASIMRLTALPPPPPTPMTLMRAPVMGGSSSMKMLIPLAGRPSGVIFCNFLSPSEALTAPKVSCGYLGLCAPPSTIY